jgi:hypothetical protein
VSLPDWGSGLGVEYLALPPVVASVALILDRRAGNQSRSAIGRSLEAINPTVIKCSPLVIAAVALILGHKDGIDFLVPALVGVLVGGVLNAWAHSRQADRLGRADLRH